MMFVSTDPPLPFFPYRSDYCVLVAAKKKKKKTTRVLMTGRELLGTHGDRECTRSLIQTVG